MNISFKLIRAAVSVVAGYAVSAPVMAQHFYAGAIDTNGTPGIQFGDAISFVEPTGVNAGQVAAPANYQYMELGVGIFAAEYVAPDGLNGGISLTALSNGRSWTGSNYRAANPYAAPSGLIRAQLLSVTGPTGAKFSLWDTAVNSSAPTDVFTIGTGITVGDGYQNLTNVNLIVGDGVNDGIGEPPTGSNATGVDPYGHIHNRNYTADTLGQYTATFIIQDANGNFADSAPFVVNFEAVPEPGSAAFLVAGCATLFGVWRRRRS